MPISTELVLHQFEFSHFNEKARWALDFKGIEHRRESYLPGPHMPAIKRLSGKTQTPVLQTPDCIISGSAEIIDHLETAHPAPPLYPESAEAKTAALALQSQFDTELGPAARTVVFSNLVEEGSYLCAMFARKAAAPKRWLYRATYPIAKAMIAKANGTTDPANVARSFEVVERTLDEIATQAEPTGYLVGSEFSIADLSAAALLAPLANPQHPDMARPKPIPASVAALISKFAEHPAIAWVHQMYAQHR